MSCCTRRSWPLRPHVGLAVARSSRREEQHEGVECEAEPADNQDAKDDQAGTAVSITEVPKNLNASDHSKPRLKYTKDDKAGTAHTTTKELEDASDDKDGVTHATIEGSRSHAPQLNVKTPKTKYATTE